MIIISQAKYKVKKYVSIDVKLGIIVESNIHDGVKFVLQSFELSRNINPLAVTARINTRHGNPDNDTHVAEHTFVRFTSNDVAGFESFAKAHKRQRGDSEPLKRAASGDKQPPASTAPSVGSMLRRCNVDAPTNIRLNLTWKSDLFCQIQLLFQFLYICSNF